jgi:zinc/manganese transport system substrate-binding protein
MRGTALIALALFALVLLPRNVVAQAPKATNPQTALRVVATFSILADIVRNVGGDRTAVSSLVGPNGDAHIFAPTPADAKILGAARLIAVNGLGFEGWMDRLIAVSATNTPVVVASDGITPRRLGVSAHGSGGIDPHAWQAVGNVEIYADNIRDALIRVDPAGRNIYETNAKNYRERLARLDAEVRRAIASTPPEQRKIITTHDAFGYFGAAYGVEFIAEQGLSTETEASARDVARIIRLIRAEKIRAIFFENITDPRLARRIAAETGAHIGGSLYSDALTGPHGPAPTYVDMMQHNVGEIVAALK